MGVGGTAPNPWHPPPPHYQLSWHLSLLYLPRLCESVCGCSVSICLPYHLEQQEARDGIRFVHCCIPILTMLPDDIVSSQYASLGYMTA